MRKFFLNDLRDRGVFFLHTSNFYNAPPDARRRAGRGHGVQTHAEVSRRSESFNDAFKQPVQPGGIPVGASRTIPTLIHFTQQTLSLSLCLHRGPEKSRRTLINGGYYFSAEQCAPALCGPSVIVSTLQQERDPPPTSTHTPPTPTYPLLLPKNPTETPEEQRADSGSFSAASRLSPRRDSPCVKSKRSEPAIKIFLRFVTVFGNTRHARMFLFFWNSATRSQAICVFFVAHPGFSETVFAHLTSSRNLGPPAHGTEKKKKKQPDCHFQGGHSLRGCTLTK